MYFLEIFCLWENRAKLFSFTKSCRAKNNRMVWRSQVGRSIIIISFCLHIYSIDNELQSQWSDACWPCNSPLYILVRLINHRYLLILTNYKQKKWLKIDKNLTRSIDSSRIINTQITSCIHCLSMHTCMNELTHLLAKAESLMTKGEKNRFMGGPHM